MSVRVADCLIKSAANVKAIYVIVPCIPLDATAVSAAFADSNMSVPLFGSSTTTVTLTAIDSVTLGTDGIAVIKITTSQTLSAAGIYGTNGGPVLALSLTYGA